MDDSIHFHFVFYFQFFPFLSSSVMFLFLPLLSHADGLCPVQRFGTVIFPDESQNESESHRQRLLYLNFCGTDGEKEHNNELGACQNYLSSLRMVASARFEYK